jgi:hypothetical protein
MTLRTVYLQKMLSINGRDSLRGRILYEALRNASDDSFLAHVVDTPDAKRETDPEIADDIMDTDLFQKIDPTVVYVEGGLFSDDSGNWKIRRPLAEDFVKKGGVLIVADCDANGLYELKEHYDAAATFFRAHALYRQDEVIYASDSTSYWDGYRQIICKPDQMLLSDWLRPAFDGVTEIVVGLPVVVSTSGDIVAACNKNTTIAMSEDVALYHDHGVFGTAAKVGAGYAVFIAGAISADVWLERCPGNSAWIINLAKLLTAEVAKERSLRASHHLSPHLLFLSHRSVDNTVVEAIARGIKLRGVGIWIDRERLAASDSLPDQISTALGSMTAFVIFWSAACVNAPWVKRELSAATSLLIEKQIPIFMIRLDATPPPPILSDLLWIEASGKQPDAVAGELVDAIRRREKRVSG